MKKFIPLLLLLLPLSLFAQFRPDYKIKTQDNNAFYQDIVTVEGVAKDELFERAKSFVASNILSKTIQSNQEDKEAGKLIFSDVQQLYAPQGFGTVPFQASYSMTIEVKDGRYRYTVDNIEFIYAALLTGAGQRESLNSQYTIMFEQQGSGLASRRVKVFDEFINKKIADLYASTNKSSLTKEDF